MHLSEVTEDIWQAIVTHELPFTVHVDHIRDAIDLAEKLRSSGRCDLFRGQANAEWKVTSSFERLLPEERNYAVQQLRRFCEWSNSVVELLPAIDDPDKIIAIAQHYGLKTQFIDFTAEPRIAAFFASQANGLDLCGGNASIICLSSREFERFWKEVGPALIQPSDKQFKLPEIVDLHVDNLWRLQAQRGCFVWNPVHNIERFFSFDRITFPLDGAGDFSFMKDEIYPENQSRLEQILARFFQSERMRKQKMFFESIDVTTINIDVEESYYSMASWCEPGLVIPSYWEESSGWDSFVVEHYEDARPIKSIAIRSESIQDLAVELIEIMSLDFIRQDRVRGLRFTSFYGMEFSGDIHKLLNSIVRLWNGLRMLPYSEFEISRSISAVIDLFFLADRDPNSHEPTRFNGGVGKEWVHVEMSSNGDGAGDYSRAYVTEEQCLKSFSSFFISAAHKALSETKMSTKELLLLPARPWQRFSFDGLRELMISEIVPTQIVLYAHASRDEALYRTIYFSPLELKILGLA